MRRFIACNMVLSMLLLTACMPVTINPNDPLENSGPYAVATKYAPFPTATATGSLEAMFYYPSVNSENNSRALVILSHGFGARFYDYEAYAYHLASHGYIVYGVNMLNTSSDPNIASHDDNALQLTEAVTYALGQSSLASRIDPQKIVLMGHSLGGKISFYTAAQDSRIASVIALDPSNAGGPPCGISPQYCANYPVAPNPYRGHEGVLNSVTASSLIFRSKADGTNPDNEFNAYYFFYGDDGNGNNAVPSIAYYIDMGGAPHVSYMPTLVSTTPAIVKRSAVAWLQERFDGKDNSRYFTGNIMSSAIANGMVAGFDSR